MTLVQRHLARTTTLFLMNYRLTHHDPGLWESFVQQHLGYSLLWALQVAAHVCQSFTHKAESTHKAAVLLSL